jgi:hypothetical protein
VYARELYGRGASEVNGQPSKDRYAQSMSFWAVWGEKDRMQEQEAEKRSVARRGTQGREWVGLNSTYVSPLAWRVVRLPSQFHAANEALNPFGHS